MDLGSIEEKSQSSDRTAQCSGDWRQRTAGKLGRACMAQSQAIQFPAADLPHQSAPQGDRGRRDAIRTSRSLPEPPDHLVVLVPAPGVPELLRNGAAAGARSATVFSSGFGEAYNDQAARSVASCAAVIAETGLAVSGPNCMGNICAKNQLCHLSEDRPLTLRRGPVALVGQSGGMMILPECRRSKSAASTPNISSPAATRRVSAFPTISFFSPTSRS